MTAALPTFDIRVYREEFWARIVAAFEVRPLVAALPIVAPLVSLLLVGAILGPQFEDAFAFAIAGGTLALIVSGFFAFVLPSVLLAIIGFVSG